jgi:protein TonB
MAVTLALFVLMPLLIAGSRTEDGRPVTSAGIQLVTLVRDPDAGAEPAASVGAGGPTMPPMPSAASQYPQPPPPPPVMTRADEVPRPSEPELTADLTVSDIPLIDALPYLGGAPVTPAKARAALERREATRKPAAKSSPRPQRSTPQAPSQKNRAKDGAGTRAKIASPRGTSAGRGSSAGAAEGKSGSGRDHGKGSSGKTTKSGLSRGVVVLSRPRPSYPRDALRNRQEGWVKLSFTVTTGGTVSNPRVVASKPRRVFDRAALQAIRKWRFKPRLVNGKAVQTTAVQVIEFNLANR